MKYRKKPVVIEALQFTEDHPDVLIPIQKFMGRDVIVSYTDPENPCMLIETPEGTMKASIGDYIIKGLRGEFYPCKPDIFKQTYEAVADCEDAQ